MTYDLYISNLAQIKKNLVSNKKYSNPFFQRQFNKGYTADVQPLCSLTSAK